MLILTILLPILLVQTGASPNQRPPSAVVSGMISAISAGHRSIELRKPVADPRTGEIDFGVQIGKLPPGRSRPSIDSPITGSERESLPAQAGTRQTLYLSDRTVCKEQKKNILCGELLAGDEIRAAVSEIDGMFGRGLYATEIERTRKK